MTEAARPLYDGIRKRDDGEFLSEREIIDELVEDIGAEPAAYAAWKAAPRDQIIFLHHTVGQAVRNRFGLWDPDNPHVVLDPEPNAEGIIDHPNFPDQASHRIMLAVWDRINAEKKKEEGASDSSEPKIESIN